MRHSIVFIGVICLALFLCGCASCSNLTGGASGGLASGSDTSMTIWNGTGVIGKQSYLEHMERLNAGQTVIIELKTNNTRIDFMVMNVSTFGKYMPNIAWTDNKEGEWTNYYEQYNTMGGSFTFTAPENGYYYFVLDNSREPWWVTDSAQPTKAVWVQLNITKAPAGMPTGVATQNPTNAPTLTATPKATASATATIAPTTMVSVTATNIPSGPTFAGTWDTDYGAMTITMNGNAVNGIYYGDGKVSGTVTGNTLTGTWSQSPTWLPPDDAGDCTFTLSGDGNSFTGKWRYGHSDDPQAAWDGEWTGTRTS
jgi:hypothetical protein